MATVVVVEEEDRLLDEFERLQGYLESLKLQNASLVERLAVEVKKVDVVKKEMMPGKRRTDEDDDSSKRTRTHDRDTDHIYDYDDDPSSDEEDDDEMDVETQNHIRTMHVSARSAVQRGCDGAPPAATGGPMATKANVCPPVRTMSSGSSTISTSLTMSSSSIPADSLDDGFAHADDPIHSQYRSAAVATESDGGCLDDEEVSVTADADVTYRSCIAADGNDVDDDDLLAAADAGLPASMRSSYYGEEGEEEDEPLYRGHSAPSVSATPADPASGAFSAESSTAAQPDGGAATSHVSAAKRTQSKGKSKKQTPRQARPPAAAPRPAVDLGLLRELVSAVGALVVKEGEAKVVPTDSEVEHALDRLQLLNVTS